MRKKKKKVESNLIPNVYSITFLISYFLSDVKFLHSLRGADLKILRIFQTLDFY